MSARAPAAALAAALWLANAATAQQGVQPPPTNDLAHALAVHPYLSKIQLDRLERAPFLFLFQRVVGAGPQRATTLVDTLAPQLDATLEVFEKRIAEPNGLALRAGHTGFVVVVLASQGDLENYQRVTKTPWHMGVWALHDRELGACVLFEDAFGQERSWSERARAARHVLLHACQQAWYSGDGKAPLETWALEGMADALSSTAADASVVRLDPAILRALVNDAQDEGRRFACLRTLEELFFVNEAARLELFYRTRAPKLQPPADAWWAYYRQASALFAYLWSDQEARLRPALVAFLGDALHGLGTAARFQERFTGTSASDIEQGFLAWLVREHRNAFPVEKFEAERVMKALERGAPDAPAAGSQPPSVQPAQPQAAAPQKTAQPQTTAQPQVSLDILDASVEERLALAVHRLSTGREADGEKLLASLLQEPLEPALKARVERELLRLKLWRELRDSYLASLAASGGTVAFEYQGKACKAKVLRFEKGVLELDKNRAGRERLDVGELDILQLAQDIKPLGSAGDWARLWPYALREDARTRKLLKEDGGQASALLADARDDYPPRLRLGRALARIDDLARAAPPVTAAEADRLVAELRNLRAECGELDVVKRKASAFQARARQWLEAKVASLPTPALFAGKLVEFEDGSVRVTYSFDDPRELEDFDPRLYPVMAMKGMPAPKVADQPFHAEGGELVGSGRAALRTRFDLGPPLSVRYGLAYREGAADSNVPRYFELGLADDGSEHFVGGLNFRTLELYDTEKVDQVEGEKFPFYLDTVYAMQMLHDGQRVFLRCEDREVSITAGARKSGAVFLYANAGEAVRIPELVLEGRLVPESLARLRNARVERELAGF